MSTYRNIITGEVRDLADELVQAWAATGNPKTSQWELYTPPEPEPSPEPGPHRILKDTLIQRIKALGKLAALRALVNSLDEDTRFEWDHSSWFHSNTPLLVQGCAAIGLTAEETSTVLAFDPLAP